MKARTNAQSQRLFGLLRALNLDEDDRKDLVEQFTNNRSSSSKDLNVAEASSLINYLQAKVPVKKDPADQMRKKILYYFHEMGWKTEKGKADLKRIDNYMRHKSILKKPMNDYLLNELPRLVSQVEIVYKKSLMNYIS